MLHCSCASARYRSRGAVRCLRAGDVLADDVNQADVQDPKGASESSLETGDRLV